MPYFAPPLTAHPLYPALNAARYAPEPAQVAHLLAALALTDGQRRAILKRARGWVRTLRARRRGWAIWTPSSPSMRSTAVRGSPCCAWPRPCCGCPTPSPWMS